jgi:serine/threonine-protein kinase
MSEEEAQKPEETKPPLQVGDIVADKYRVDEIIGQGAMGFVFAAEHTHLGHRVALKVLRAGALEHKESVERFLREGRIVARIQSEHVARVSDVGTLKSGVPYLVMEFLEGSDLSKILKQRGEPLALGDAVDFTLQICEALAHAHTLGVVHRDMKPANIYVTSRVDGTPLLKVLDFGISKSSTYGEGQDELTMTAALMGTPRYMSPEQIHDSRLVDARTDIWALGTILYEMLTLERCFQAPSVAFTCVKILQQEPTPLTELRPDLPPQIAEIVARCLRKEPTERWLHVGELAEAIAPFGAPDAPAIAARISRVAVTTSDNMKHSGPRAVLGATGSFTAATGSYPGLSSSGSNPSAASVLRISGSNSSSAMVSSSPGASPASESSKSSSGAIARASTASVPSEPAQQKRGKGLVYGGLAVVAIVAAIVMLSRGGKQPEGGSAPASNGSSTTSATVASAAPSPSMTAGTTVEPPKPTATTTATATAAPSETASATATATSKRWTPPTKTTTTTTATTTAAPSTTAPPKPTSTGDNVLDDRR